MRKIPSVLLSFIAAVPLVGADYTFTNILDSRQPGFRIPNGPPVVINANGEVAFNASRLDQNGDRISDVILAGSGGPVRTLVDSLNQFQGQSVISINSSGTVLFSALRNDFTTGLYTTSGGVLTPVPTTPGEIPNPFTADLNDDGVVAYWTGNRIRVVSNGTGRIVAGQNSVSGLGQLNRSGTLAFLTLRDGVRLLVKDTAGQQSDVAAHSTQFNTVLARQPAINDSGSIAIAGTTGAGVGTPALFRFDGTAMTALAQEAVTYSSVNINNSGTVAFARVVGSSLGDLEGIYVGSDSPDGKVIAVGDTLFGSRVTALGGSGATPGRFLNDKGQIAFWYTLADLTKGIAVASPATAAIPALQEGTFVNGASYLPNVVSGSWAQVKGTDLASDTRIWGSSDFASSTTLPTALDGVEVKVNGLPAAVYFISPGQISFQVPNAVSGPATVQVIRSGVASNTVSGNAVTTAPGLFSYLAGAKSYPAAVYANTTTVVGDPTVSGNGVRKARPGDRVALYATGLAPSPAGVVPGQTNFNGVTAMIGAQPATVEFSGLVAVGQFQINIVVPNLAPGEYPLVIRYNGEESQPGILFPVQE